LERVFVHYGPYVAALLRRGFSFHGGEATVHFGGYDGIFDLEDVVQEVFRRALSPGARASYDGLRPFRAYLTTIAKNTVINDYHARRRALERFSATGVDDIAASEEWSAADAPLSPAADEPSGDPARDAQTRELRRLVGEFRAGLDADEARVFTLRFQEGLSHATITERTALSPSKIKTIEIRIRKTLLRFMRKRGYLGGRPSGASARTHELARGDRR